MSAAHSPSPAQAEEVTLRQTIERLRSRGTPMSVAQAVGLMVPLANLLADQHREGYTFFLYPSALLEDVNGNFYASGASAEPPTRAEDLACLPPESRGQVPGNSRESVYGVAAILYELITLRSVGPGMLPPSQLVGSAPALDAMLSMALAANPAQRPDDLKALAQALAGVPTAQAQQAAPAPRFAESHHSDGIDIDVSMSMLPAPPTREGQPVSQQRPVRAAPSSPYDVAVQMAPPPSSPRSAPNQTSELAALKARLESDPRPLYVVIKDGMDHGPFNAVELLQQIASNSFEGTDKIRDNSNGTETTIADSPNFSQFAHHARLNRQHKAEKAAIERVVAAESRSTKGKAFIGVIVVGVLLAGGAVWFLTQRGARNDEIAVHEEQAANVESEDGLKVKKKAGGGAGRVVGKSGNFPLLGGGMSCEAAQAAYVEEMKMGATGQADLSAGQFQQVLGNGTYLNGCGVPDNMSVSICAAVQNGRAVGVSVRTTPSSARHQSCIAGAVRGMSFPSHPKLDVTRTSFAAQ